VKNVKKENSRIRTRRRKEEGREEVKKSRIRTNRTKQEEGRK